MCAAINKPLQTGTPGRSPTCGRTGLPDFPRLRADQVLPLLEALIDEYQSGVERHLSASHPADWAFVDKEIGWSDAIERAWAPISHLNAVADESQLREVHNKGLQLLTRHHTWRQQHRGIFELYRALRQSGTFAQLTGQQQRIIELELRDFHLSGVDLDEAARKEYRQIVLRISELGTRFQENLLDATHAWTLSIDDPGRLAGLPETELRLLAENARSHSQEGWLVDLSYPSYSAIMTHAEDRQLREEVYTAYVTRASDQGPHAGQWDNTPVIDELLGLRHRLAQLLGFESYVEYALSTRMADQPATVEKFLLNLAREGRPAAQRQLEALREFASRSGAGYVLQAWDMAFWSERFRQSELKLSDEQLKPYFPLEAMIGALFHICGRIFGISLEVDSGIPVWHPDVKFYWLHDRNGDRIAGLYMDLYARKGKRAGAWMDVCRSRRVLESGVQLPVAFLNCNFPMPSAGHPSLLTHHDLQTLFHEFGHCLHHMLTEVDWPQINGISNVEWDAVELPSQLLENWCWEEHLLNGFARHYQSGESLPAELKHRLLRSHHFHKALMLMRQLEFALCDLRLHLEYDPDQPRNPLEVLAEVRMEYAVVETPAWNRFLNSFTHIFGGGYSAGYYSYLWAEQLAADAWERFQAEGAFNSATGQALRAEIYAVGASRPAAESFQAFRGQAPRPGPLLKSYGLADDDRRPIRQVSAGSGEAWKSE